MSILIIGGSGFIGQQLCQSLINEGQTVIVKTRNLTKTTQTFKKHNLQPIIIDNFEDDSFDSSQLDTIISLAGAGIVDKRWTNSRKQELIDSRIQPLLELKDWLINNNLTIPKLLVGSAIGYYGFSADPNQEFIESTEAIEHFSNSLCKQVEDTSEQLKEVTNNIVQLRTAVVLGKQGGALSKMLLPAKLHLNGPIGNGRQWLSWIHIQDWINAVKYIISLESPRLHYNLSSPQPATNAQISATLAKTLNKTFQLPVPAFSLKLILGEASDLLTRSQKVLPANLQAANFEFLYPDIESTCQDLINS